MGDMPIARTLENESLEPSFVLISKTTDSKPVIKNATVIQTRGSTGGTKKKNKKRKNGSTKASKKTPKPRATLFGLSSIKRDGDVSVNMMSDHTTVKTNFILGPLTLRVEKEVKTSVYIFFVCFFFILHILEIVTYKIFNSQFGNGAKRELKSATATTAEMHGYLTLRIMHGGAATLHSIKVLQPKQVNNLKKIPCEQIKTPVKPKCLKNQLKSLNLCHV